MKHDPAAIVIESVDGHLGYHCMCGDHYPFGNESIKVMNRGSVLCRNCPCGVYVEIIFEGGEYRIIKKQMSHHFDADMKPVDESPYGSA